MKYVLFLMVACCAGCDHAEPLDAQPQDAQPLDARSLFAAATLVAADIQSEFPPESDRWNFYFNRLAKGPPVRVEVAVRLDSNGRLRLRTDGGWKPTTLRQFGVLLRATNKRHYKLHKNGDELPSYFVGIETFPDARWEHVLWVLSQCAEQGARRVQIRVPSRTVRLYLPVNGIACGGDGPPLQSVEVRAFTRANGDRFRVGGRSFGSLPELRNLLKRKRKEFADADPADEFMTVYLAEREATVAQALDAFNTLIDAGLPNVEFWAFDEPDEGEDEAEFEARRKRDKFRGARSITPKRCQDLVVLPLPLPFGKTEARTGPATPHDTAPGGGR